MKNLLIGSRALKFQNVDFRLKDNADYDVISIDPIEGTEHHRPDFLNNFEFERYALSNYIEFNGQKLYPIDKIGLSIIKRSHLWRDLSFDKHITMYHKYLSEYFKKCNSADISIYNRRLELTRKEFKQGHPSLNKTVENFFDDFVTKKYDHDMLHEMVAFYDRPLYTRMQRDSSMAWCNKDQWDTFSLEDKSRCVAEETMVIAIERFLVPNDWNYPEKLAYFKSLKKVCTTLTSGWFRDHAIDHYPEIINLFDSDRILSVKTQLGNI